MTAQLTRILPAAWLGRLGLAAILLPGAVVGAGLFVEFGALFARTVLLARLLGAEEFGIVVSLNTLSALVAMLSFIGVDRFLIYAPDGGERHALAAAHALSLLRGLVASALVLALAFPAAALAHQERYLGSYVFIAVIPLLSGAMHLSVSQMQRAGRFLPASVSDASGAVIGLGVAGLAALIAPDHRAILWGLFAQTVSAVLMSHLLTWGNRFEISFDRRQLRRALAFGLPLLVNGVALAVSYQLDRMIVAFWLGVAALGVYGIVTTLLLQPVTLALRLVTTTLQPRLSRAWHFDPGGAFQELSRHVAQLMALGGCIAALITVCVGALGLRLLFGPSFSASEFFFIAMSCIVMVRLGRGCLNLIGLSIGCTADLMISNIVGGAALPLMIAGFAVSARLETAAMAGLAGEILGFAAAWVRLKARSAQACKAAFTGLVVSAAALGSVSAWLWLVQPGLWMRGAMAVLFMITGAFQGWLILRRLRHEDGRPVLCEPPVTPPNAQSLQYEQA